MKPRPDSTPIFEANSLMGSDAPVLVGYFSSFAMTAVATVVAVAVDRQVMIPNLSLVFVVPVVIAATNFGLGPSVCSAILGALAYNFFLTEPRYTLVVDDPANVWAIGLLFVVGLMVSGVAFTSQRRATEAAALRRQAALLRSYSRDVTAAGNTKAVVSITSQALAALFQVPAVVMLVSDGKVVFLECVGGLEPRADELEAATSSVATRNTVRAEAYPDFTSRFDFWPVATTTGQCAVLGLAFAPDERPSVPRALVDIVGSVLALVLDRQHLGGERDTWAAS